MVGFVNPLTNVSQGQEWVNGLFQQQAQNRAGRSLATGDYGGASRSLLNSGDLQGGLALQERGDQRQAAQEEQAKKQKAEQLASTLQITRALRSVRDRGGDVATELPKYRDAFIAMGTDPAQLSQIESQIAANPAFLDQIEAITGQQLQELEIVNYGSGRGGAAINKQTGAVVTEFGPQREPLEVDGVLIDPETREVILDTRKPQYQTVTNSDGTTSVVAIDQPAPIRAGGSGSTDPQGIIDRIIQREGGFVASDGRSGAPANFGINQRANPDVDVRNLTKERAAQIYQDRYVNPIVQAGVQGPALEAVIDFGVNAGVGRSLDFWRRSGGDVGEFNRLRLAHYRSLPDYQQNGRSWERRVAETTPGQGGSEVSPGGGSRVVAQGEDRGLSPAEQRRADAEQTAQSSRQFTQERQLRSEFGNNPAVKTLASVRPQVQIIGNIARRAAQGETISAQDDLALIFSYMKMLDPGSVVREGEFANAQNTAGIPERVTNAYNNALRGTRLSDNQRSEFFRSASGVMNAYQSDYESQANRMRGLASEYGLSPDRIAPAPAQGAQQRRPQTNAPGLRFNITPQQLERRQAIVSGGGRPSAPLGSRQNPRYINPADPSTSFGNVRRGEYFVAPDGQLRGPKP